MKKLLKYAVCLALLVMVVALFTGCDPLDGKVTGGGWFEGDDGKCTFGFVAQGVCGEYKGQFQFNDHAERKIHAEVVGLLEFFETQSTFTGEFVNEDGSVEYLVVSVWDIDGLGLGVGDYIKIWFDVDSIFDLFGPCDYEGELGGGQLKVHKEK